MHLNLNKFEEILVDLESIFFCEICKFLDHLSALIGFMRSKIIFFANETLRNIADKDPNIDMFQL